MFTHPIYPYQKFTNYLFFFVYRDIRAWIKRVAMRWIIGLCIYVRVHCICSLRSYLPNWVVLDLCIDFLAKVCARSTG